MSDKKPFYSSINTIKMSYRNQLYHSCNEIGNSLTTPTSAISLKQSLRLKNAFFLRRNACLES